MYSRLQTYSILYMYTCYVKANYAGYIGYCRTDKNNAELVAGFQVINVYSKVGPYNIGPK
jgi:hypothetical protein